MLLTKSYDAEKFLTIALDCRAPRRKVYETWTQPEWLKKWFRADEGYVCTVAEVDLRVGGAFALAMAMPGKEETRFTGVYQTIHEAEGLVYSWQGGEADHVTLVTALFSDHGTGSRVDFTHGVFATAEAKQQHEAGWVACFGQLAKALGE